MAGDGSGGGPEGERDHLPVDEPEIPERVSKYPITDKDVDDDD
jgi:hypothetical protein